MASPPLPDPRPDLKPRYSTLFRAATCCLFVVLFRCCCCCCFAFVFPSVLPLSCLCLPFCVSCVVFPVVFAFVFPSVFPLSCLCLPFCVSCFVSPIVFAVVFPSVFPLSCLCLPFCVSCVVFPVVFAFVFPSVFPLSCLSLPCLPLSSLLRTTKPANHPPNQQSSNCHYGEGGEGREGKSDPRSDPRESPTRRGTKHSYARCCVCLLCLACFVCSACFALLRFASDLLCYTLISFALFGFYLRWLIRVGLHCCLLCLICSARKAAKAWSGHLSSAPQFHWVPGAPLSSSPKALSLPSTPLLHRKVCRKLQT